MMFRILVVEDSPVNMALTVAILESAGHAVLQAEHAVPGMEIAREERPDLILMDIQLPEVSGLEVTKWLKDDPELQVIPVVAVTAFAMKGDEEKIREGGCEAYIAKPISVQQFLETVRRFLG
jgi:two-component system cell cycle response regulator DivK